MADEIDQQLERDTVLEEANIKRIREQVAKIPVGKPATASFAVSGLGDW